jgi:hypothetical protein
MTLIRKPLIRRVQDVTLGTSLTLALLNGTLLLQSCGNTDQQTRSDTDGSDYEQVETFGKGVQTTISEIAPGEFKIVDETEVGPDQARAVVRYQDGHTDTLSVAAARRLVQADSSTRRYLNNPNSYAGHHHNGLANALLWGGMGYMLGRNTAPQYRQDQQRYGSGLYASSGLYTRSRQIGESVRSSRTVSSRPSGARGGFFGSRGGRASS